MVTGVPPSTVPVLGLIPVMPGRPYTHTAPRPSLSPGPPTTAVWPSPDSATEVPCSTSPSPPIAPLPTSLLACWVHTPPLRTNTHAAPAWELSRGAQKGDVAV